MCVCGGCDYGVCAVIHVSVYVCGGCDYGVCAVIHV